MLEGPSLVILREALQPFESKRVLRVFGSSRLPIGDIGDIGDIGGKALPRVRTWGKQLLLEFYPFTARVHFLLYGSWLVDERKETTPRLSLGFARGREANFYACSVRFLVDPLDELYDWSGDVMSDSWDAAQARRKLRATPGRMVADVLLDQDVFAGVGNIIKNEVLHRIRLHPGSRVGALSARKLGDLVHEARDYSFDFYRGSGHARDRRDSPAMAAHTAKLVVGDAFGLLRVALFGRGLRMSVYNSNQTPGIRP